MSLWSKQAICLVVIGITVSLTGCGGGGGGGSSSAMQEQELALLRPFIGTYTGTLNPGLASAQPITFTLSNLRETVKGPTADLKGSYPDYGYTVYLNGVVDGVGLANNANAFHIDGGTDEDLGGGEHAGEALFTEFVKQPNGTWIGYLGVNKKVIQVTKMN